jgi:hypothetical protein
VEPARLGLVRFFLVDDRFVVSPLLTGTAALLG